MSARVIVALAAAAAVCLLAPVLASSARADGDPASDVLYFQDEFLPYPKPSAEASQRVNAAVAAANKGGFRIKVAVIASSQDLGSVPSLFGRPQTYAQFLGVELRSFYRERLVVVMPAGFGVYRGGRSVTAEQRTIAGVKPGASADELASAAATAVGKLRQALGHRRSGDSRPPHVQALSSSGKRGGVAPLRYKVSDNSGRARTELRVYGPNYNLYATLQRPFLRVRSKVVQSYKWKVPPGLPGGAVRFCVLAADHAGNLSTTSCAALRLG